MGRLLLVGVPVAMLAAGVVLVAAFDGRESEGAGYTLIGAAALLAISQAIFRAGLQSNEDRDREERARVFYDEHGRWPGRGEPGGPPAR